MTYKKFNAKEAEELKVQRMAIPENRLSYEIIGAAIEVHRTL